MLRFETRLALRHLISGGGQTILTIAAVAIAVFIIIFIQTLVTGVQERILKDLLGTLPHVTVEPPDPKPDTLHDAVARYAPRRLQKGELLTSAEEKAVQQRTDLEDWRTLERQLAQFPHVRTVVSAVRGNAFLIRGEKRLGVTISGGDPSAQEKIVTLQEDIIAGRWLDIGPDDIVIGWRLAEEMGLKVGDTVRVSSSRNVTASYRVAGIFDTGNNQLDRNQAFLNLRAAQSLFAVDQNVSSILLRLDDGFRANEVADRIALSLPYKTTSWMRESPFIVNAFQSQDQSRILICGFALTASAFGIASVLFVSVVQKSKQIGILKSMGARDSQILLVFTLEGLGIALVGSVVGVLMALAILRVLENVPQAVRFGKEDKLFNIIYDPAIFAQACFAAIIATLLAALLPARRASRMNPVEVIRGA